MFRRFLAILIVVFISVGCVAFGEEDFTLHSGTKFGMTSDEVIETESLSLSPSKAIWYPETGYLHLQSEKAKIAGRENASVHYYFDENNRLISCIYGWNGNSSNANTPLEYEDLVKTLTTKYGEPIGNEKSYVDIGKYIDAVDVLNKIIEHNSQEDMYKYCDQFDNMLYQWQVPIQEGVVDIMLTMCIVGWHDMDAKWFWGNISYTLRTTEELEAISQEIQEKQDALNDDL